MIDHRADTQAERPCLTAKSTFDPAFSDAEREELGHLDYLVARLDELRERGLIAPEACATVVAESQGRRQAIELSGRYRSAVDQAKKLAKKDPRDALEWAECARELDPSRVEAWKLIVALNWDLGDDDEAIARCALGGRAFPRISGRAGPAQGGASRTCRRERRQAEHARQEADVKGWLAQARLALERGRDAEVIALCPTGPRDSPRPR